MVIAPLIKDSIVKDPSNITAILYRGVKGLNQAVKSVSHSPKLRRVEILQRWGGHPRERLTPVGIMVMTPLIEDPPETFRTSQHYCTEGFKAWIGRQKLESITEWTNKITLALTASASSALTISFWFIHLLLPMFFSCIIIYLSCVMYVSFMYYYLFILSYICFFLYYLSICNQL